MGDRHHIACSTDTTQRQQIMQRWHVIQHELRPELAEQLGLLTPKLEKVIYTLE